MADDFHTGCLHRLRQGRWSHPGNLYFITTATARKQPFFGKAELAQIIFDSLEWLQAQGRADIVCCVVMPDHLHMVVQLGQGQTLSALMDSFKGFTGRRINEAAKRDGPVWQEQYYDHCIRRDEDLNEIIRYCHENPVRAGLVEEADEYPFWRCKFEVDAP